MPGDTSGPIDWPTAFWQPEASAWLAQHFYEHYLFSRDDEVPEGARLAGDEGRRASSGWTRW